MESIPQPRPLLLASMSPRRRELLNDAGYEFEISVPPFAEPETSRPHVAATEYVESLAYFKACSVAEAHPAHTILAADTVAFVGGEIIGKAKDRDDARRIILQLSGTTHEVITGVVLLCPRSNRRMIDHDISTIRCRQLRDEQIEAYLDSGEWEGKAGAYGIQDHEDLFVQEIEGSFSNVVGLPMEKLAMLFRAWEQGS